MTTAIFFDGGCKPTNPGPPYGSFILDIGPNIASVVRGPVRWKQPFTTRSNNEAEYLTLWLALNEVLLHFPTSNLKIFSDSMLLVNQMSGKWKCRNQSLFNLRSECLKVLNRIAHRAPEKVYLGWWEIGWISRDTMVELFGH